MDETGIDFHNRAVLWVSHPILEIVAPHDTEQHRKEDFTVLWVQYILIDAKQVVQLKDKVNLGGNARPASLGNCGHFEVGGVRMQCHENERLHNDFGTCFCQEPYANIKQGPQDDGVNAVPRRGTKKGSDTFMQFRNLDYRTLVNHRKRVLAWVASYDGHPWYQAPEMLVSEITWEQYEPWRSKDGVIWRPNRMQLIGIIKGAKVLVEGYLSAMTRELPATDGYRGVQPPEYPGSVWQQEWPRLPRAVLLAMRSREWGEKLAHWPVGHTMTGTGERELMRIGVIFKALELHVFAAALPYAPEEWICPSEVSRSDWYKNLVMKSMQLQALINERWRPDNCVPHFDERVAAGNAGCWNFG
jgi:hypothetical protein